MQEKEVNPATTGSEQPEEMSMSINADESISGSTHLNESVADESEMEKLQEELQEQKDKYLRLYAEFDNFKRRTAKERIELSQTAGKEVIQSLLDVLDDCDRAEKQLQSGNDIELIRKGVQLVFHKLRTALQQRGVKEMTSIGKDFDPDIHEAITEIPAPSSNMKGKVIDQLEKGYYLNDKIIRFAKVVVGK
jgi:molecular chaperone GrpE